MTSARGLVTRPGNPRPAAPGTPNPGPGQIGKRGFPVPCFPIPGQSGIGKQGNPGPPKAGKRGIRLPIPDRYFDSCGPLLWTCLATHQTSRLCSDRNQESGIPAGILLRNGPCQVRFRNSRFQELTETDVGQAPGSLLHLQFT